MKTAVFINQSPNGMLYDIAGCWKAAGYKCILISGNEIPGRNEFDEVVLLTPYSRTSPLSRFYSWFSFYRKTADWLRENEASITDLFLVSNPPFNFYLPYFNPALRSKNISCLFYDLYPDIIKKMLPAPLSFLPSLLMRYLNRKSLKYADHIYAPSQSLNKAVKKYTDKSVKTIYNWNDTVIQPVAKKDNLFLQQNGLTHKYIVLYSGNLGATHDVETMLQAAKIISGSEIAFVFIGHGEGMQAVDKAISNGAGNIYKFGWQDQHMFNYSISCGDLAWIGYKKGYEEYSIPSKLPFYLAAGTPVISIGNRHSELSDIILANKLGYQVDNGDSAALAELITQLSKQTDDSMKSRCRNFAQEHFSPKNAIQFYN